MNNRIFKSLSIISFIPLLHFLTAVICPGAVKIEVAHLLLIYGILCLLTGAHLFVTKAITRNKRESAPIIVMGLNMLKMILSIVLLFVVVVPLTGKGAAVALNFAVAYMFFLIFDSQIVILMMKE